MSQLQHVPVLFQIPTPYSGNPWVRKSFSRAVAFHDDLLPAAVWPQVLQQYQGHEEPLSACLCGGQYWYNATTGGHKCPDCLTFTNSAGDVLGATKIKEEDHV